MATREDHVAMITSVAEAIGHELCQEVAFVGGSTTALLVTDNFAQSKVRHTDDVDMIVHVISKPEWYGLIDKLRSKGFKERMESDGPICSMYLKELRVDFMPDDESVLGFSNQWYKDAFEKAELHFLTSTLSIRLISPVYFMATKIVAYQDRGEEDPMSSRDIEDILTLIDGRSELLQEMLDSPGPLKTFVSDALELLLKHRDFDYAIQDNATGDESRAQEIRDRISRIISFGKVA